ncbi:putative LacI-family transcriptional regulator [Actinoplanes missouriensis 431]|uniref:Putative LacI-family transcriptional regulator n=1 Tax=Actinoplanes missouriensis (strain ATCC 14538 / DSM 43046 / CBS 188.64 / JCM 3121 / NBRC 102363 / NCIMB 12654 / NRRL B-3342 / UNCC 431) TaxID=512565 RepID=I0H7T9_ACTM4|nr:LacI family DNA-binding transcriptional regulator [Actinoplanes missouriensis]BAL89076.1 putative LacI-family transcriptional regulator [Actinoplanes missouriensis 431]
MAVTLRDVAKALGVSHTTVSNAYNRPEKLSDQLRLRILGAAEQMGYQGPDPLAAGLVRRQAGALGVLFDEDLAHALTDPAAQLFLQGVARAGQTSALALTLLPGPQAGGDPELAARTALVDGFIVYSVSAGHPGFQAARRRDIPLVVVDEPAPPHGDDWMYLGVDDRGGAAQAAQHLRDLGHRRVAVLVDRLTPGDRRGPVDAARLAATTYQVAGERLAGYRSVLGDTPVIWECGGGAPEHAVPAARALLAGPDRVTAVLAMTDELARGFLRTAETLGYDVPGDVSVIGFDDVPEANRTDPPLTTVRQPLIGKGVRAVEVLTGARSPGERLPATLVTRATTAPPPD